MALEGINLLILSALAGIYLLFLGFLGLFKELPILKKEHFTEKPGNRVDFFDFVKGIAIVAIIVIHTTGFMIFFKQEFSHSFLLWNELFNRIARFAIPIFFISSGALLFLKDLSKESLKKFYFTKAKRILLPYASFSFFATYHFSQPFNGYFDYIFKGLKQFFEGSAAVHFWFIPVLFQLYLLYPLFWYIFVIKKVKPSIILAASFVFSLISYFLISTYYLGWQEYIGGFFGPYLFFFVLGITLKPFFLSNVETTREWLKKIKLIYWIVIMFIFYLLIGALNLEESYFNVRLIYGPSVMFLMLYIYPYLNRLKIKNLIQRAGKQSLYIYLLHFFVLYWLAIIINTFNLNHINPYLLFISFVFWGFFITYFLIIMVQKAYNSLINKNYTI